MNKKIFASLMTVMALSLVFIFAFPVPETPPPGSNANASPVTASAATYIIIDQYEVMYSSSGFPPRIWLKTEGMGYIGQLIFRPNGQRLPADSKVNDAVNLYYHLDDFQNCIDILRSEHPVYLVWTGTASSNENGIKTTPEPVGEGGG